MIIIRIQGGLGNQLFQYAAGKSLAHRLDTVCKLDLSSLHQKQVRKLELDYFSFTPIIASKKEIKQFIFFPGLYRHRPSLFSRFSKNIYREQHFHYNKNFPLLKDPIYLDGYWQSEKYFEPIADLIRQGYKIKKQFVAHVEKKVAQLQLVNSVAVHIRRGDYTQKKYASYHGVLKKEYYNNAIEMIKSKSSNLHLCIFSDDIDWVKQNIRLDMDHEFISNHVTTSAIEDFYLMSQCKHNIIANSSFSWWAAWLNNNPDKIVIAPQNWFNLAPHNTKDLIPPGWIRI